MFSVYCSWNKKGDPKKRDGGAIGCLSIATIYFLNYKDAIAEAWRRWASLPRTAATCVKEEGGKSWKLSEIEHDFFEKRSPAPLWDYELFSLSSFSLPFVFAIYPSRISSSSLPLHFRPQNFTEKKIVFKFIRKSWDAVRYFLSTPFAAYAIRLPFNLPKRKAITSFSRTSLNVRSNRFL